MSNCCCNNISAVHPDSITGSRVTLMLVFGNNVQSIPSDTSTPADTTDSTALVNIGGIEYNIAGNFTIPKAGLYLISAFLTFSSSNPTGDREVAIISSNLGSLATETVEAAASYATRLTVTTFANLVAGDVITFYMKQNTGFNLNTKGPTHNRLSFTKLL